MCNIMIGKGTTLNQVDIMKFLGVFLRLGISV